MNPSEKTRGDTYESGYEAGRREAMEDVMVCVWAVIVLIALVVTHMAVWHIGYDNGYNQAMQDVAYNPPYSVSIEME